MNEVLLINGANNYKLPHVGKLKIVSDHGRDIPHRLPCKALNGEKLDTDAIVDALGQQTIAEALLDLGQEEEHELIAGLESLTIDEDLTDGMSNGVTVGNDGVDSNARGGNRPGSDASLNDLNDLRQMGRVLHRFDHFESFFDDFVSEIEWGGEDYDGDVELSEEIALYDANEQ